MSARRFLASLRDDRRGSTIIEFAILAPVMFAMMIGVLHIGLQMQNYNALRSVASDTARYTVVEYQKANKISTSQIETMARAMAVSVPYMLQTDNLTVTVTNPSSEITGATKFSVALSYTPPSFLGFIGIASPTLTYSRPIYVPT